MSAEVRSLAVAEHGVTPPPPARCGRSRCRSGCPDRPDPSSTRSPTPSRPPTRAPPWCAASPGGRSRAAAAEPTDIVAGGNLAVSLAYGDYSAVGVGTATTVCGGIVTGFGHPMLYDGATRLGMHGASAVRIVDDPTCTPYKLANPTGPVGTIDQDRLAAVSGRVGPLPADDGDHLVDHQPRRRRPPSAGPTRPPPSLLDAVLSHGWVNYDTKAFDDLYFAGTSTSPGRSRRPRRRVAVHGDPSGPARERRGPVVRVAVRRRLRDAQHPREPVRGGAGHGRRLPGAAAAPSDVDRYPGLVPGDRLGRRRTRSAGGGLELSARQPRSSCASRSAGTAAHANRRGDARRSRGTSPGPATSGLAAGRAARRRPVRVHAGSPSSARARPRAGPRRPARLDRRRSAQRRPRRRHWCCSPTGSGMGPSAATGRGRPAVVPSTRSSMARRGRPLAWPSTTVASSRRRPARAPRTGAALRRRRPGQRPRRQHRVRGSRRYHRGACRARPAAVRASAGSRVPRRRPS